VAWPQTIGLIGSGAMGRAMLAGFVREQPERGSGLVVADAVRSAANLGVAESGGRVGSITDASACDLVVVAVKPKDAADVLSRLAEHAATARRRRPWA